VNEPARLAVSPKPLTALAQGQKSEFPAVKREAEEDWGRRGAPNGPATFAVSGMQRLEKEKRFRSKRLDRLRLPLPAAAEPLLPGTNICVRRLLHKEGPLLRG